MGDYEVRARWKEELVCKGAEGSLVFEMTMGVPHVYFPTPEKWLTEAPAWAKGKRDEILEAIDAFCKRSGVPLTIDDKAWVGVDTRTDGT